MRAWAGFKVGSQVGGRQASPTQRAYRAGSLADDRLASRVTSSPIALGRISHVETANERGARMMGAEGAILKCAPDVEMVPLAEGGSMLVDLKSGHCFQLNRVGADVWRFFQGGGSPSTIVDDLLG